MFNGDSQYDNEFKTNTFDSRKPIYHNSLKCVGQSQVFSTIKDKLLVIVNSVILLI